MGTITNDNYPASRSARINQRKMVARLVKIIKKYVKPSPDGTSVKWILEGRRQN